MLGFHLGHIGVVFAMMESGNQDKRGLGSRSWSLGLNFLFGGSRLSGLGLFRT